MRDHIPPRETSADPEPIDLNAGATEIMRQVGSGLAHMGEYVEVSRGVVVMRFCGNHEVRRRFALYEGQHCETETRRVCGEDARMWLAPHGRELEARSQMASAQEFFSCAEGVCRYAHDPGEHVFELNNAEVRLSEVILIEPGLDEVSAAEATGWVSAQRERLRHEECP